MKNISLKSSNEPKFWLSLLVQTLSIINKSKFHSANAQSGTYESAPREISFTNDGLKLAGTLFLPNSLKHLPAIVITHGSGKEGRHLGRYQYLGKIFAKFGFATFIFDKRGIGESEGLYLEAGDINIPAGDLLAATLSDDISFVIFLVGGGTSIKEQVLHHRKSELIDKGWSSIKIDYQQAFAFAHSSLIQKYCV